MLEVVLYDRAAWREHLLPFVYTRPVGDLRVGILTLREKWQLFLEASSSFYTSSYLTQKFQAPGQADVYLAIRANICPSLELVQALKQLEEGSVLLRGTEWIAYKIAIWDDERIISKLKKVMFHGEVEQIRYLEDIFLKNRVQLGIDYVLLTEGKTSALIDNSNVLFGDQLFVGEGVDMKCCTLNTTEGPIYIDDGAILEEGAHLKGPISIGRNARVKMGTRLYSNVTIGPGATVGGEVNNTVMWGDCAKGHDGYLGCAVIGEGCNIGAGSSNSNLQNNWSAVKVYDYGVGGWRSTGITKVGTFMGDFSMCGINSSITTGCVIGVGAQVAMSNIIPKFVADFSWITDQKKEAYDWRKFETMMHARAALKRGDFDAGHTMVLAEVFQITAQEREKFISTKTKK